MKKLNLVNKENTDIPYKIIKFPDGQQQVQVMSPILADPSCFNGPQVQIISRLNNFSDLEIIICAAKSLRASGVRYISLYTPYFLGSRSDRKFEFGTNNYLKDVICPIINSLNFESVTVLDPHSDVLEACLNNFEKELNTDLVKWVFMNHPQNTKSLENFILVSPDAGATKKIYKVAKEIEYKGDIMTCSKDRDSGGYLTLVNVPFSFDSIGNCIEEEEGKDFIIIDDICDGGRTFIEIAKELKQRCPKQRIYLIVTHGIFSKGFGELQQYFEAIYTTNSYQDLDAEPFVKQLNLF